MLSDDERDDLRHRALMAWHDATRLGMIAHELSSEAAELTVRSHELTSTWDAQRSNRLRQRRIEKTVDEVLSADDPQLYPNQRRDGPVGLLAMSGLAGLIPVYQAAAKRYWRIVDAIDGARAVGVAMLTQPDCAVLDANLPILSGLEVAERLQLYAPRTAVLLLCGDSDIDTEARRSGFYTLGKSAPLLDIITTMQRLAA